MVYGTIEFLQKASKMKLSKKNIERCIKLCDRVEERINLNLHLLNLLTLQIAFCIVLMVVVILYR